MTSPLPLPATSASASTRESATRDAWPLVTVILPVHNGMPFLPATLAAVAAQPQVRLQCLAIDDGSSDASAAILAAAPGWTVLQTPGRGPNPARQLALGQAEGEFVAFLDQDDIWHRDHLARGVAALRKDPAAAAVVAPRQAFERDEQLRLGGRVKHSRQLDPWALFPITVIDTPSMVLLRTDRLREAGGWPDDRVLGSDPLLWWRLSTTAPLAVSDRRSVGVRRSRGSLSARQREWPLNYARELQRAMRDALRDADAPLRTLVEARGERLMEALLLLLEALIRGESLTEAAWRLERSLADASQATHIAAVGFLGWLLAREMQGDRATDGRDVVLALLSEWPRDARRSAASVRRMVAATAAPARILAVLGSEPTGRSTWHAAEDSVAFRTARWLGRIDDPLGLPIGSLPRQAAGREIR